MHRAAARTVVSYQICAQCSDKHRLVLEMQRLSAQQDSVATCDVAVAVFLVDSVVQLSLLEFIVADVNLDCSISHRAVLPTECLVPTSVLQDSGCCPSSSLGGIVAGLGADLF